MRTKVLIRPAARGGKYLGPDAADKNTNHSAHVSLKNLTTGHIVEGYVNTLDMDAGPITLMDPVRRCDPYTADAATIGITLEVDIDGPTNFLLTVRGPLSFPDQARTAQAEITILPGVDIGQQVHSTDAIAHPIPEGLVIEVPGLCISHVEASWSQTGVEAKAMVTMMCGCKINDTPANWYWLPRNFNIQLVTHMKSGAIYTYKLDFYPKSKHGSSFIGNWKNQAGPEDVVTKAWIFASQPKLGNQGQYHIPLEIH
jgi:hypothetical protein